MPATKTDQLFWIFVRQFRGGLTGHDARNYLIISDTCLGRGKPCNGYPEG
jgi:hypothetical protein